MMAEIWFPSHVRELAGWTIIVWFVLLLIWPGSRD